MERAWSTSQYCRAWYTACGYVNRGLGYAHAGCNGNVGALSAHIPRLGHRVDTEVDINAKFYIKRDIMPREYLQPSVYLHRECEMRLNVHLVAFGLLFSRQIKTTVMLVSQWLPCTFISGYRLSCPPSGFGIKYEDRV